MIKKLQHKFVLITMSSLLLVITLVIGSINVVNLYHTERRIKGLLRLISENSGKFPEFEKDNPQKLGIELTEETQYQTRYFTIETDKENHITGIDTGFVAAVSEEEAREYAWKVLAGKQKYGYWDNYKYLITEQPYGKLIIFVDCTTQIGSIFSFLFISVGIAMTSLLFVFILVSAFSKRAIRPVIESMERQKQFITDAGHEIKTPLAIISANAEVLKLTGGENEWLSSILNQTDRLDKLVKNLLTLSKMGESSVGLIFTEFSFSDAVAEIVKAFESMAEVKGKRLETSIEEQISLKGDETSIRQLVSILVDNAVKYSDESGMISVSLKRSGKLTKLEVYNTSIEIPQANLEKLFERFYRTDSSRARETGGYGIGLSIAENIVTAHKGKLTVHSTTETSISFVASF